MPTKSVKISPNSSTTTDKKVHTAGLGFVLLILTNYQAEVKQILQVIVKWIT